VIVRIRDVEVSPGIDDDTVGLQLGAGPPAPLNPEVPLPATVEITAAGGAVMV
jgi:hypothetical protein